MQHSDSIQNLAKALSSAQGEMKPAAMASKNPFLGNKYADLGEIIKAAVPALSKHGLSFCQPMENNGADVTVTTILMHETGEWISSSMTMPGEEKKGLSAAQSMGAIVTYMRRYSLASMIGMYADEDTDAQNGNNNGKQAQKPANKEQVKPQNTNAPESEYHVEPPTTHAAKAETAPIQAQFDAALVEIAKERNTTVEKLLKALAFSSELIGPQTKEIYASWLDFYAEARKREGEAKMTPQEAGDYADKQTMDAFNLGAI